MMFTRLRMAALSIGNSHSVGKKRTKGDSQNETSFSAVFFVRLLCRDRGGRAADPRSRRRQQPRGTGEAEATTRNRGGSSEVTDHGGSTAAHHSRAHDRRNRRGV